MKSEQELLQSWAVSKLTAVQNKFRFKMESYWTEGGPQGHSRHEAAKAVGIYPYQGIAYNLLVSLQAVVKNSPAQQVWLWMATDAIHCMLLVSNADQATDKAFFADVVEKCELVKVEIAAAMIESESLPYSTGKIFEAFTVARQDLSLPAALFSSDYHTRVQKNLASVAARLLLQLAQLDLEEQASHL